MKNREFKFRFWDIKNSKWEKNFGVYHDGIIGDFSECFHNTAGKNGEYYIAQQYTGLKDKNEKEIYEGDLVNFESNYYGGEIAVVSFYNSMFILYPTIHLKDTMTFFMNVDYKNIILDHRVCRNCKIIGNTTENPELIK